ncbi:nitrogen regulation protein NR(II) [Falsigemmobacter faecalis]|uniref:PAS domain-containing protein n=1 Tax=Falsigemmobacter faecalis TaxID=2488730 RepID=A0A3P3DYT3_9RHOB|nr:hypothetical protein [Falsigemmobacter faecalis]RRH77988.1 hypothetical protein EG244_02905 [Falsigemmobacter faecalis]
MIAEYLPYLGLAGFLLSMLVLGCAGLYALPRRPRTPPHNAEGGGMTLLFDGDRILDATAAGRAFLAALPPGGPGDWHRFFAWAKSSYGDEASPLQDLKSAGVVQIGPAADSGLVLRGEWRSGLQHLTLVSPEAAQCQHADAAAARLRDSELARLRAIIEALPLPLWSEDPREGIVTSVNSAYDSLLPEHIRERPAARRGWPPPPVIPPGSKDGALLTVGSGTGARRWRLRRLAVPGPPVRLALPAEESPEGEDAMNAFVRTLALTFAGLPIGLAVFAPSGELRLFNPALADLTTLPVEFLAARPRLSVLLDELRHRNMLPEPRDYPAWRARIASIGSEEALGYEEIWPLPDGQTFQVAGHSPAPGAITLLIHDISHEVSRSRRLRTDLALGQSVLDAMEEAVIVFSASGDVLLSNSAYDRLWHQNISESLTLHRIGTICAAWRAQSTPDPLWPEVERWLQRPERRDPLDGMIRRKDGRALRLHLKHLPGDAVLVTFRSPPTAPTSNAAPTRRPRSRASPAG